MYTKFTHLVKLNAGMDGEWWIDETEPIGGVCCFVAAAADVTRIVHLQHGQ